MVTTTIIYYCHIKYNFNKQFIGGVILINSSAAEKKLDKAKESVRICKFNIKNQEKKLWETNKKIVTIQSKIAIISLNPSNELKKLRCIYSKLMHHCGLHEELILEFKEELILSEDNLEQLKSNSIHKDL
jgi:hypothetical protein